MSDESTEKGGDFLVFLFYLLANLFSIFVASMNLSFGDLMADGSIVDILRHFTSRYPEVVIFFTGSTTERTRLYARILKTYYALFSKDFIVYGIVGTENNNKIIPFDPQSGMEYFAFLIKRIN